MSQEEEISKDIKLLDNVLLRLATVTNDKLQGQVDALLVPVLSKLSTPHDQVRQKVLDVLRHFMLVIKPQQTVKLPVKDLIALFLDPICTQSHIMSNVVMIYVEIGYNRADLNEKLALFSSLFQDIHKRTSNQQLVLLSLGLAVLEKIQFPIDEEERNTKFPFYNSPETLKVILDFYLDVLLFQPIRFVWFCFEIFHKDFFVYFSSCL